MIFPPKLTKVRITGPIEDKLNVIQKLQLLGVLHVTEPTTKHPLLTKDNSLPGVSKISEQILQLKFIKEATKTKQKTNIKKLDELKKVQEQADKLIRKYLKKTSSLVTQQQKISKNILFLEEKKEKLKKLISEQYNPKTHNAYESNQAIKIKAKHITYKDSHIYIIPKNIRVPKQLKKIVLNKDPKTELLECEKKILQLKNQQKKISEQLESLLKGQEYQLLEVLANLENYYSQYTLPNKMLTSNSLFVIEGYAEQKKIPELKKELDCLVEEMVIDKNAPTKLKNNKYAKNFQVITELYSIPKYQSADPTGIISLFYPLFFGFMLSDVGYGLLMLLLTKLTDNKELKNIIKICAGSTIIFGVLFGSIFGGLIPIKPILLNPFNQAKQVLLISLIIGLIHMNIGVALQIAQYIRKKAYKEIITKSIPFIALEIGSASLFFNKTIAYALIITAIIILLIDGGIMGLMQISGYLGNWFSYARLLALSLATAGVALAINIIANKIGVLGPLGAFISFLILVLGHLFNFIINIVGTTINAARLHYVEFFSFFYEGGGELFKPFKIEGG